MVRKCWAGAMESRMDFCTGRSRTNRVPPGTRFGVAQFSYCESILATGPTQEPTNMADPNQSNPGQRQGTDNPQDQEKRQQDQKDQQPRQPQTQQPGQDRNRDADQQRQGGGAGGSSSDQGGTGR